MFIPTCKICDKDIETSTKYVKVTEKGAIGLNRASDIRRDNIHVLLGHVGLKEGLVNRPTKTCGKTLRRLMVSVLPDTFTTLILTQHGKM